MANHSKDTTPPVVRVGSGRGAYSGLLSSEKPKNTRDTLLRLLRYLGKSRGALLALLVCMLLVTGAEIAGPMLQQKAIDTISYENARLTVDFGRMRSYLMILLVMFILSGMLTYGQGILAAKLSQQTIYILRRDLFQKIEYLPIRYIDTHPSGDLMSRMTNDVENVSNAIAQSITALLSAALTLTGALCMMLYYSRVMTGVAVVMVLAILLASTRLTKFMRKYYKRQQSLLGQLNGQAEEKITGFRTVVAYGKERETITRFAEVSEELRVNSIRARVWGSILGPITNFIGNFQYVLLAGTGGFLMIRGNSGMTVGGIQAMLQYSKKLSHPVNMIANQYNNILTALAGAERIFEILDSPRETDEGTKDFPPEHMKGEIEFQDVQFEYTDGEPVLRHLNLLVKAGQKIAIVGATGSGKTTVVNLLTRFYEPVGGRILIDGTDITQIPKRQLRSAIAIVLQDTVLFQDSIRMNIEFGRNKVREEDRKRAAVTAMADQFIERLPEGYDTILAEDGTNLSEGQRQLLSIARAVLADPRILILDEATSSVDTRTEMQIQQAMVNLMKGRTSLVIAHRISTIRDADLIVVIKNGAIAEQGSHEELMELRGEYYRLYSSQFQGAVT